MRKDEFLTTLRRGLNGLPKEDVDKSIEYYSEMIDDRIEDGLTEDEATAAVGNVDDVIAQIKGQILSETSLPALIKQKFTPNRPLKTWEIILLILGAPIWVSILLAAIAVVCSVYAVLWIIVAVTYAIDVALAAVAVAGILSLFLIGVKGAAPTFLFFGVGLISAGLAILLFFISNKICKIMLYFSKQILLTMKSWFIKKEDVQ